MTRKKRLQRWKGDGRCRDRNGGKMMGTGMQGRLRREDKREGRDRERNAE